MEHLTFVVWFLWYPQFNFVDESISTNRDIFRVIVKFFIYFGGMYLLW